MISNEALLGLTFGFGVVWAVTYRAIYRAIAHWYARMHGH